MVQLSTVPVYFAKKTPGFVKKWVHRSRLLERITHRTFASVTRIGGPLVTIQSGPLQGLRLSMSEHVMSSHITATYEQKIQLAIDFLVSPGFVCYDVGASIGYFSLLMASKAKHVYAFEPAPHAAKEIGNHVAANQFQNVTVVTSPVSDSERMVNFSLTEVAYGSRIADAQTKWPTVSLRTITLDDFVRRHPCPDFLKIDVEGEEAKVLLGARSILRQKKTVICCELHSRELAYEVSSLLSEHGYRLENLDGEAFHIESNVIPGEVHVLGFPS